MLWAATRDAWYVEMICLRVWWNKSCRLQFLVIAFVTKAMRPMEKCITTAVPWFDPTPTRDPMDYTSQRRSIVTCFVICTRPSWLEMRWQHLRRIWWWCATMGILPCNASGLWHQTILSEKLSCARCWWIPVLRLKRQVHKSPGRHRWHPWATTWSRPHVPCTCRWQYDKQ